MDDVKGCQEYNLQVRNKEERGSSNDRRTVKQGYDYINLPL